MNPYSISLCFLIIYSIFLCFLIICHPRPNSFVPSQPFFTMLKLATTANPSTETFSHDLPQLCKVSLISSLRVVRLAASSSCSFCKRLADLLTFWSSCSTTSITARDRATSWYSSYKQTRMGSPRFNQLLFLNPG